MSRSGRLPYWRSAYPMFILSAVAATVAVVNLTQGQWVTGPIWVGSAVVWSIFAVKQHRQNRKTLKQP